MRGAGRRDSAVLGRVVRGVWQSLSLATDKAERILNILESQSKTIYDRSSFVVIQLTLLKGAENVVQGKGIVRFWKGLCGERGCCAIPPSWRQKVCNIKMVGISQAESNNIKACALPSIHLPLTREASVMVQSKEWCGFGKVVGMADFCVWWVCRGGACPSRWIDVCDFLIVLNLSSIKGKMQFLFALDFFWIVYYNYNDV